MHPVAPAGRARAAPRGARSAFRHSGRDSSVALVVHRYLIQVRDGRPTGPIRSPVTSTGWPGRGGRHRASPSVLVWLCGPVVGVQPHFTGAMDATRRQEQDLSNDGGQT